MEFNVQRQRGKRNVDELEFNEERKNILSLSLSFCSTQVREVTHTHPIDVRPSSLLHLAIDEGRKARLSLRMSEALLSEMFVELFFFSVLAFLLLLLHFSSSWDLFFLFKWMNVSLFSGEFFCPLKAERERKRECYSMIFKTLPTATVLPSSRRVNLPSWGKRLNGSMQIACPTVVNSKRAMATWSCLTNRGCSWVRSPVFRSIKVINFFNWTSTAHAWRWRTAE